MLLLLTDVRVGWAAILHNGVIVPGTFVEEQYNCALCNLAWGWFCGVIVVWALAMALCFFIVQFKRNK
jgi:hypothetical protein